MRRLIAVVLVLALVLALGGISAWANETEQEDQTEIVEIAETEGEEEPEDTEEDEEDEEDEEEDEAALVAGWDVTGTWALVTTLGEVEYPQSMDLTMDTATGAVTGTGTYESTTYTLAGAVVGDTITLTRENDGYSVELEGTVTATSMSGTWSDSNEHSGTWTATGTAVQLTEVASTEGFAWTEPISVTGKVFNMRANIPIKFTLGTPAAPETTDETETTETDETTETTELPEDEGEDEEVDEVGDVTPVVKLICGEFEEIMTPRLLGNSAMWMGHFRPSVAGEHTAEVWVGETLVGSITFVVAEPGPHGLGAMEANSHGPGQNRGATKNEAKVNNGKGGGKGD